MVSTISLDRVYQNLGFAGNYKQARGYPARHLKDLIVSVRRETP